MQEDYLSMPPVYRLTFTNEVGVEIKSSILLDASSDEDAVRQAEALIVEHPHSAACLWADARMLRQYVGSPPTVSERMIKSRASSLRSKIRP